MALQSHPWTANDVEHKRVPSFRRNGFQPYRSVVVFGVMFDVIVIPGLQFTSTHTFVTRPCCSIEHLLHFISTQRGKTLVVRHQVLLMRVLMSTYDFRCLMMHAYQGFWQRHRDLFFLKGCMIDLDSKSVMKTSRSARITYRALPWEKVCECPESICYLH